MSAGGTLSKGDKVRVTAGPQRGREGEVVRVMKMPRESDSAALVLVRFAGGEDYHVAANLEKLPPPGN